MADIICVSGGNEIYLAQAFGRIGMKDYLIQNCEDKVYVGISAGSMVAGINLDNNTYEKLFMGIENYGYPTIESMALVPFSFVPHMNSEYFKYRKETLKSLQNNFKNEVYALDDHTALSIDHGEVKIIGKGEYFNFKNI